nr:hypothetical protein Itr_chr15CG11800 [Ipomoea trifida]
MRIWHSKRISHYQGGLCAREGSYHHRTFINVADWICRSKKQRTGDELEAIASLAWLPCGAGHGLGRLVSHTRTAWQA